MDAAGDFFDALDFRYEWRKYQRLVTQTQEREFLDRLGRTAWLRGLVEEGGRDEKPPWHTSPT